MSDHKLEYFIQYHMTEGVKKTAVVEWGDLHTLRGLYVEEVISIKFIYVKRYNFPKILHFCQILCTHFVILIADKFMAIHRYILVQYHIFSSHSSFLVAFWSSSSLYGQVSTKYVKQRCAFSECFYVH